MISFQKIKSAETHYRGLSGNCTIFKQVAQGYKHYRCSYWLCSGIARDILDLTNSLTLYYNRTTYAHKNLEHFSDYDLAEVGQFQKFPKHP